MSRNPAEHRRQCESAQSPTLPSLEPGLHLVDVDERAVGTVQSLVIDQLLTSDSTESTAVWVDSNGVATTSSLARLAPSTRLLERIHVARAFTPYQHHSLVSELPQAVTNETSLLVVPEFEYQYRSPDLEFSVARELVEESVEWVRALAREREIPVLMTRETTASAPLSMPLVEAAESLIECELTRFGPRFVGEEFETLVYPVEGGFQTTLSYWVEVLSARFQAIQAGQTPASPSITASEPSNTLTRSSHEVTVDGTH